MFKALVVLCCFGSCAIVTTAQTLTVLEERGYGRSMDSVVPSQPTDERRLALRAALVAQREATLQQASKAAGERQLSHRERAELRQQLRQQQQRQ